MVDKAGLRDALERFAPLENAQLAQIEVVLDELGRDPRAPSAVRDERALAVHIADSLAALELDALPSAGRIVDVGSGAGFPGTPLAIALPGADVTLLESQRRKSEYLAAVCARARIANARAVCARAEDWPEGIGVHDAVTARALASQAVVLEYAAPLLRPGGVLVDWRGRREPDQEERAARAGEELGLRRVELRRVEPFGGARARHLHVFVKAAPTPARFPRRPGVARKRPLGGRRA